MPCVLLASAVLIKVVWIYFTNVVCSLLTGSGAIDYILKHAEIDFVFVQDKKMKEVRVYIIFF